MVVQARIQATKFINYNSLAPQVQLFQLLKTSTKELIRTGLLYNDILQCALFSNQAHNNLVGVDLFLLLHITAWPLLLHTCLFVCFKGGIATGSPLCLTNTIKELDLGGVQIKSLYRSRTEIVSSRAIHD